MSYINPVESAMTRGHNLGEEAKTGMNIRVLHTNGAVTDLYNVEKLYFLEGDGECEMCTKACSPGVCAECKEGKIVSEDGMKNDDELCPFLRKDDEYCLNDGYCQYQSEEKDSNGNTVCLCRNFVGKADMRGRGMTNGEAIKILEEIEFDEDGCYKSNSWFFGIGDKRNEALQKAIKTLQSIEDIKAEINNLPKLIYASGERVYLDEVLEIIDKHLEEKNENNMVL